MIYPWALPRRHSAALHRRNRCAGVGGDVHRRARFPFPSPTPAQEESSLLADVGAAVEDNNSEFRGRI